MNSALKTKVATAESQAVMILLIPKDLHLMVAMVVTMESMVATDLRFLMSAAKFHRNVSMILIAEFQNAIAHQRTTRETLDPLLKTVRILTPTPTILHEEIAARFLRSVSMIPTARNPPAIAPRMKNPPRRPTRTLDPQQRRIPLQPDPVSSRSLPADLDHK